MTTKKLFIVNRKYIDDIFGDRSPSSADIAAANSAIADFLPDGMYWVGHTLCADANSEYTCHDAAACWQAAVQYASEVCCEIC